MATNERISGTAKLASLALMGLMLVFWVVFLSGTAAQHDRCVAAGKNNGGGGGFNNAADNTNNINTNDIINQIINANNGRKMMSHGRNLLGAAEDACRNQFSFTWWVVWFQFIILGLIIGTTLVPMLKPFSNVTVLFVAMVSVLLMSLAYDNDTYVFANKDNKNKEVEKRVSATRAAEAGIVGLLVCNFVYLLLPAVFEAFGGLMPASAQPKDAVAAKGTEMTSPSGPEVYYLPPLTEDNAASAPGPEDAPAAPAPGTPPNK